MRENGIQVGFQFADRYLQNVSVSKFMPVNMHDIIIFSNKTVIRHTQTKSQWIVIMFFCLVNNEKFYSNADYCYYLW